jgi:hypothetical protein
MNTKKHGAYLVNPSVEEIIGIKLVPRNIKNKSQVVVDKKTGQHWEQYPIDSLTTVADTRTFIKVYQQSVVTLKDMTNVAIKLYCYILFNLKPNKDQIRITYNSTKEFCGFGNKMSFYNGLEQLLDGNFIFKTEDTGFFWINVNLFFNGNRLNLVDEEDVKNGKYINEKENMSKNELISNFEK